MGQLSKKRAFSGIQPTGNLHIGNYLGAVKNWVGSQDEFDNIFCIVDLHAITVKQDPEILKAKTREVAGILLAAGIDLDKSTLFVQSQVGAHAELAWILNCFTTIGELSRMTQFKEKSEDQRETVTVGLFDYPVLMAADILLYNTDVVPVGDDQQQHVELARDIAKRFNSAYGETFRVPEAIIPQVGARIMSLVNPAQKMSKSEAGEKHSINLLDPPDEIVSKIKNAMTDSRKEVVFDETRPGLYNLLTIFKMFTGLAQADIELRFKEKGYEGFKTEMAEVIVNRLKLLQDKYKELTADSFYIDALLKKGAEKVRPIAEKQLEIVKEKVGLG